MRYKMTLSYDGSAFSGWQIQSNAPSVQAALEEALSLLFRTRIQVVGAGRTDAGVHARNYVAHFDLCGPAECDPVSNASGLSSDLPTLCRKLNSILPASVAVHSVEVAADDFHARFSARRRQYKYYIHRQKDPFRQAYSWYCRYSFDVERMNRACSYLPGVHDCSCFEKKGSDNVSSICEIFSAGWEEMPDGSLVFTIEANRFLRNMVRAIVGTMVDIGRNVHEPEYIETLLRGGTRSDAGQSVPGYALFLTGIEY